MATTGVIWRLRDIEIDEVRFELRRAGRRVAIAPKPLRLLLHLARRHPTSVAREELLRTLWPGVHVTPASIARAVRDVRRALDDSQAAGVIRTVRGRGYALADAPVPMSAGSGDRAGGAEFIGRAAEVARLEEAVARVESGCGCLATISGAPGIGKTSLAAEIVKRAAGRGFRVVSGMCREDPGAPPYWPWPEVVAGIVEQCGEDVLRSLGASARDLAPVVPRLRVPEGPSSHAPAPSDADARFRLFQGMTTLLRDVARSRPLLVLIEDLHWARAASIHLLQFLSRATVEAPLFVVATHRTAGAPRNAALQAALGELASLPRALPEIRLEGFPPADVAAYVQGAMGASLDAPLVQRLHAATGGNPLFVRSMIPLMTASGPGDGAVRIPPTVEHVLHQQLRWLSRPARMLVELAAVIGSEGSLRLLTRSSSRPRHEVHARLDEAAVQHLVHTTEDGRFRFTHDLVRAALYHRLRPPRRAELHARIGRALAALTGGSPESHLADLAHHFVQALPRVEVTKAVRLSARAAMQARHNLDFDGAARHCRGALRALDHAPVDAPRKRCDLLLELGDLLNLGGNAMGSRAPLLEAALLAQRLRSPSRLARAALTMGAWPMLVMEDPVVTRTVEQALTIGGPLHPVVRARLLALLATLRSVAGRADESARLVEDALALARRLRDPSLRSEVLLQRQLMLQAGIPREHRARLDLSTEALAAARRAKRVDLVLLCRRLRIGLLVELGARPELDEEIDHFERDSAAARSRGHYAAAFRAMRALMRGRFAEARLAIDETERLGDPLSPEERRFTPTAQRYWLPPERGLSEVMAERIQGFLAEFPHVTGWHAALARVLVNLEQADAARVHIRHLVADDFAAVPRNGGYVVVLASLADVACRLGEAGYAPALYERLLPYAGTHATPGMGISYDGPIDYRLGQLAGMLGRRSAAGAYFDRALVSTARLGARPWHARTQAAYAKLLAEGRPDERRRAVEIAGAAAETAARLGMPDVREEADRIRAMR